MEVSAKSGVNVKDAFMSVARSAVADRLSREAPKMNSIERRAGGRKHSTFSVKKVKQIRLMQKWCWISTTYVILLVTHPPAESNTAQRALHLIRHVFSVDADI